MPQPACGRIVLAEVADPQGKNPKVRPLVILTADADIQQGTPVVAAAISTSFDQLDPAVYVALPWHPGGLSRTKLTAPCVAVCNWLVEISPDSIVRYGGWVPSVLMRELVDKIALLP
ncbi:MAG: type II toxin-antitoxin system PemK/MazF family toxin [Planctomycetia bacterium]|nr:type II toxin-antitoxin system PemK/MazF family toxin [Planctomycetia bacterium]